MHRGSEQPYHLLASESSAPSHMCSGRQWNWAQRQNPPAERLAEGRLQYHRKAIVAEYLAFSFRAAVSVPWLQTRTILKFDRSAFPQGSGVPALTFCSSSLYAGPLQMIVAPFSPGLITDCVLLPSTEAKRPPLVFPYVVEIVISKY
jgi:hypothetical protein